MIAHSRKAEISFDIIYFVVIIAYILPITSTKINNTFKY